MVDEVLLFGIAYKIYNVGRLGFFVRDCVSADTGMLSLAKSMIHRYWSKKMPADVGQEKMTDRGLKKKHDRMTPIEHFQIDIVQVLFRGGIERTVASIGS